MNITQNEKFYMNLFTGSIDTASGWEPEDIESGKVEEVIFNPDSESWELV
jgi:hypothetical protein